MSVLTLKQAGSEPLNFSRLSILVADGDQFAVDILGQILRGFGVGQTSIATTGAAAMGMMDRLEFDLIVAEAALPDMDGTDIVRWIRRHEKDAVRYTPVVMLTGHTEFKRIESVRDCGANSVVKKPVSPSTLFDHIAWSACTSRAFILGPSYFGPDRRFRHLGPPDGVGRRSGDLPAEIGTASEPNLSQDEVDSFMRPTKIRIE